MKDLDFYSSLSSTIERLNLMQRMLLQNTKENLNHIRLSEYLEFGVHLSLIAQKEQCSKA